MTNSVDVKKSNINDGPETWSPGWNKAAIVFGVALLIVGIVFGSTFSDIVVIWWRAETYAHGFLVLPIVGYLIWKKRTDLASLTPQPDVKAALLMLFPALFWLLGVAAQAAVVEQFAVVAMLPVLVLAIFGREILWRILFPLAYLFFAVPAGDFLVGPLQDFTAVFTVWAVQMTGIPVYWEGRFFHIPSGSFEVAVACSGIRYLIASMALGTLYAYLNYVSLKRRLIFIALAAIVPIIANGFRAYGIVMLAHLSDYTLAVGADHLLYGWVFFGVVIMLLFWAGSFFHEDTSTVPGASLNSQDSTVQQRNEQNNVGSLVMPLPASNQFIIAALLVTGIAVSAPGFSAWMDSRSAAMAASDITLPMGQGEWSGPFEMDAQWQPSFRGSKEHRAEYRKNGQSVQIYLAYYPSQNKKAELINWHNVVFDEELSRRLSGGSSTISLYDANWPVISTRIDTKGRARVIWHWYEVGGHSTVSRLWAKVYATQNRLQGSGIGSAAWVISSEYSISEEEAAVVLKDFLSTMLPALRETTGQ